MQLHSKKILSKIPVKITIQDITVLSTYSVFSCLLTICKFSQSMIKTLETLAL
jgi:hypothetical protein